MITYAIIGAGWRSAFYVRLACLLPDKFSVSGIFIRNPETRKAFAQKYSVKICSSLEELLQTKFDFLVCCVSKKNMMEVAKDLSAKNIPVLCETPVSHEIAGQVQVAEQYHFQPQFQAYQAILASGILGEVMQVKLSCCHDYHAASLIRFLLGTGFEVPTVTSVILPESVTRYNGRAGLSAPSLITGEEKIHILRFQNKTAVYDFTADQYFSAIRENHTVIRGTNGEICDHICTYLKDGIPHRFEIVREDCGAEGNLDGLGLRAITGNGEVLYQNPFFGARLSDEEIAVATCLVKMKRYVDTGEEFYSTKDAAFDFSMF